MIPASVNIDESAVDRKKIVTRIRPAAAPSSGRRMRRVSSETRPSGARPAVAAIAAPRAAPDRLFEMRHARLHRRLA